MHDPTDIFWRKRGILICILYCKFAHKYKGNLLVNVLAGDSVDRHAYSTFLHLNLKIRIFDFLQ